MPKSEFQRHKTSDKVKWVLTCIAFVLVAVMLAGICLQVFGSDNVKPSNWFTQTECEHIDEDSDNVCDVCGEDIPDDEASLGGGMAVVPDEQFNGVRLMSRSLTAEQFDEYGISPLAESAIVVTAEVEDENGDKPASYQYVTFSMAWASTKSEPVTDYVTMTTTDNSATFECLKAFDTQIKVTVTSVLDTSKTATFTIDYYQRMTGVKAELNDESYAQISDGETVSVQFAPWSEYGTNTWNVGYNFLTAGVFGTGSVSNSVTSGQVTIEVTDEVKNILGNGYTYKSIQTSGSSSTITGLDKTQTFIFDLIGKAAAPTSYGNDVMNAFASAGQDVKVTIKASTKHGEMTTITYYLAIQVDAAKIGNINLSGLTNGGLLF